MKDVFLVHPLTQAYLPVFVADYVLMDYGTGAIMAVPAHDERDYEFARRFKLSITPVIKPHHGDVPELPYTEYGELLQSGEWTGMSSTEAISSLTNYLEEHNLGKKDINYKMRDWVFSRQRYWGEPIPIVYCEECGEMPVPEDQLPVELPEVDAYEP
ncbi:MAG: leucine--tRNA ligase, partial [Parcubacteria group bacterium SW_4_49_11]